MVSARCYSADFDLADFYRSGYVKPLLPFEKDLGNVSRFIRNAQDSGRRVIMLARGGHAADRHRSPHNDQHATTTVTRLLESKKVAIVVLGARDSKVSRIRPTVLQIPNLKFDFALLLSIVDIVVHHGGC